VLLVSEVATNALRHTYGQVVLELWLFSNRLRVEVSRGPVTGGRARSTTPAAEFR